MKKLIFIFFLLLAILTGLSACKPTNLPTASPTISSTGTGPYPAGSQPNEGTYPSPPTPDIAPAVLQVTPDPNLGSVKGFLQVNTKPVPSANVYLASLVKNAEGQEVAAALDRTTAPTAITQSNGSFNFINVPPGRYAIMYQGGPDTYLLYYPDRTEAIIIEITTNEPIDLGVLNYEDLPM